MYRESLLSFNIHHLQENKIEHRVQQNTDNLIKFHLAYSLHKIEYNTNYMQQGNHLRSTFFCQNTT